LVLFSFGAPPAKFFVLRTAVNVVAFGLRYSMAKPTKSRGGVPDFQFMAARTMPSPRYSVNVNGAAALTPSTLKPVDTGTKARPTLGCAHHLDPLCPRRRPRR
jgi:hypothetical protein